MKKHHTQVEHRHCYLKKVLDQNKRMLLLLMVVEEVEEEEDIWELKKMMIVWKRRY